MRQHKNISRLPGFTLVELLIVIVIIAILAAITVVAYNGIQQRARQSAIQSDFNSDAQALTLYQVDKGSYPYTGAMFIASGAKFSTSVYKYIAYCYDSPGGSTFALVAITSDTSKSYVYTPEGGLKEYTGNWSTMNGATGICAQANPSLSTGVWLYSYASGYASGWSS